MKLFLLILFFPFFIQAQNADRSHSPKTETKQVGPSFLNGPVFQLSYDNRFERDETQEIVPRNFLSYAGGYIYQNWIFEGEYGGFETSSGNATLSVRRKTESLLLWTYWQSLDFRYLIPYIGAGLGGIHDTVETKFLGTSETDESPWNTTVAAAFGIRFFARTHFWVSLETRLYKNTHLDPDPQFGALARFGAFIF